MKKNIVFHILSFVLLLLTILLTTGCGINVVEGGSDAGNAKLLIGKIVDIFNQPISNAEVLLKNKADSTDAKEYDTTVVTDTNGEYRFAIFSPGMYFITAKKDDRYIAFIDSIHLTADENKTIEPYKVDKLSVIRGKVIVQDTSASIINNVKIRVLCKEIKYDKFLSHGETFMIHNIPRGKYTLFFESNFMEFIVKSLTVSVQPDDTIDCGDIIINKGINYLKESNVMSIDLEPLMNVPADQVLRYTFTERPIKAGTFVGLFPENIPIDIDTVVINDYSIFVHPAKDLPGSKKIGVHLWVIFEDNTICYINLITDSKKHFTTDSSHY